MNKTVAAKKRYLVNKHYREEKTKEIRHLILGLLLLFVASPTCLCMLVMFIGS